MKLRLSFWLFLTVFGGSAAGLWSQSAAPMDIYAQRLVDKTLAKHRSELIYVGLHLVPPDQTESLIAAATDRSKIGKKSSCSDLNVLKDGVPVLEMKGSSSTVLAPLHDESGQTIGLAVIGLKFGAGQESEAARDAKEIDQELSAEIPSKAALFQKSK